MTILENGFIKKFGNKTYFSNLHEEIMSNAWTQRWNERYSSNEYAYGNLPNDYLKEQLGKLPIGTILFPAEGEGRNAVFAAKLGWKVFAFDISDEGKSKAMKLAKSNQVHINYQLGDLQNVHFSVDQFDTIAFIYAHFPADIKSIYHQQIEKYLRKGGFIIFEAFSKNNLAYQAKNEMVGGPKDIDSLFSIEEIQNDFSNFEIIELVEKEIELHEGLFHNGLGSVIRFVGKKK